MISRTRAPANGTSWGWWRWWRASTGRNAWLHRGRGCGCSDVHKELELVVFQCRIEGHGGADRRWHRADRNAHKGLGQVGNGEPVRQQAQLEHEFHIAQQAVFQAIRLDVDDVQLVHIGEDALVVSWTDDPGIADSVDIQTEAVQLSGGQDNDVGLPAISALMLVLKARDQVIRGAAQPGAYLEMERHALCRLRRMQLGRQCNYVARGEIDFGPGQLNHIVQAILRLCSDDWHRRLAGNERIVAGKNGGGCIYWRAQEPRVTHNRVGPIVEQGRPLAHHVAYNQINACFIHG